MTNKNKIVQQKQNKKKYEVSKKFVHQIVQHYTCTTINSVHKFFLPFICTTIHMYICFTCTPGESSIDLPFAIFFTVHMYTKLYVTQ